MITNIKAMELVEIINYQYKGYGAGGDYNQYKSYGAGQYVQFRPELL